MGVSFAWKMDRLLSRNDTHGTVRLLSRKVHGEMPAKELICYPTLVVVSVNEAWVSVDERRLCAGSTTAQIVGRSVDSIVANPEFLQMAAKKSANSADYSGCDGGIDAAGLPRTPRELGFGTSYGHYVETREHESS